MVIKSLRLIALWLNCSGRARYAKSSDREQTDQAISAVTEESTLIVPVIIAGGAGARLWPLSREAYPKPFIRLADGLSLIQHALRRAAALSAVREIVTVANRELLFEIRDHYAEMEPGARHRFILEPEGRDTAAAIATAALETADAHGRDAVMCIFPGDHIVTDIEAFVAAVEKAVEIARDHRLVTLGIRPDAPETAYGYIEADGTDVVRFVEKPDSAKAAQFLAAGRFLWNSGMFFCEAGTMVDLMEAYCPDILAACRESLLRAHRSQGDGFTQVELRPEDFSRVRKQSIDYAVLEKAPGLAVVPCDIGWSDIGSWNAFARLEEADRDGNTFLGTVAAIDTRDTFVRGEERLVATLGVENLVIVDTADALLVAAADRAQDVKQLLDSLKAKGHPAYREHPKVHRPWGTYTVLETGARFKIKRIEVKPGGRLSLQMHHHRSEHWVVVAGRARVVNGDREMFLEPDQSTYIPAGNRHRLENAEATPLILIEVQTGSYLEEDDIVRFDDIYGRTDERRAAGS
jgi:mannose-1-phosphate guanylyltransferase / mannose-6-phosphate isomerase